MKALRMGYRAILMLLVGLVIGLSVYSWNARTVLGDPMPMPLGFGISVVLSGSMEPALSVNDLVIVKARDPYAVGDIVVYQSGRELIIHRIVEFDGDRVITRGDANNVEDAPVNIAQIRGKKICAIPRLGALALWVKTVPGMILIVALACILMDRSWRREKRQDDAELEKIKEEIRRLKTQSESRPSKED